MLCVAASRFGGLPQRAEAAARGVSEGLPLAGDTGMLQGRFQGCAPEMPALKCRLYYLSAICSFMASTGLLSIIIDVCYEHRKQSPPKGEG